MLTAYERHLLACYLANAASGLRRRDSETAALAGWTADGENRAALGAGRRRRRRRWIPDYDKVSKEQFRSLREALQAERQTRAPRRDRTGRRLLRLSQTAGLSRTDTAILELLLRCQTHPVFESLVEDVFVGPSRWHDLNIKGRALSLMLGLSPGAVARRFGPDKPLVRTGLVSVDDDGGLKAIDRLGRLAFAPGEAGSDVNRLLFDAAPPSELDWSDFDHVAGDRDHVERLLEGALDKGAPGVNILLYGPPGTGKTEFCKTVAERLGVTLYSVGEADGDGGEPSRRERMQELRLAQRLLAQDRRSLLLFDEMEDLLEEGGPEFDFLGGLFSRRSRGGPSRVFMHRLLERAPAPTLWAMNDPGRVSPAILRRMMFAFELRAPTSRVRARVWERQLDRHGVEAKPEEARALAMEFDAAPGVAAGATAAARLAGGDIEAVRRGVRGLSRLLGCAKPPEGTPERFDPALIRADTDPAALAERIVRSGAPRFSLCLQGPPGTGKSAWVRHLAERLGLEVLQKRTSDLLSMWVGGTEQQIADAFAEARDAGALLVFDEADSLLADRRFAERNWEVSQVNEMLTWMESHPLPFACTTNFGEHLDPATLRRFTFKVALDYLAPEQADAAFRAYFGLEPPACLRDLAALAPGDFAVVRRKAEILDLLGAPGALAEMLRRECDAKPGTPRVVGFRA
ncbi:MAG: AAA family ATPase [Alphaproteobacteria bacterium]|nr:AAA family ATPase [Alphaproteobacteria bacterium]